MGRSNKHASPRSAGDRRLPEWSVAIFDSSHLSGATLTPRFASLHAGLYAVAVFDG
ncbi:MAG: hypothetical protein WKF84_14600 [Pyrinomonadaceae bacterium]